MPDIHANERLLASGGDQAPLNDLDEAEHESETPSQTVDDETLNDIIAEPDQIETDPNVP
ncbi:hypothetical protein [Pseudomonas matsuisoli]|uniref:Uncharacterized protein n=1 Tax=Pseudomonas matsuisoli TaxID=1515666 RepID=A0A917UX44_9PSED|nr:hypothetical protein [Pseudomonas matsuisoli]GGJ91557.1 hypothetical protein GCM10009304_16660 [Pseudomonas matsuisoli]